MSTHWIELSHKTSTGHRIPGHENGAGKCARLHGHTYEFDVQLSGEVLGEAGFLADFGAVKKLLDEWDHRTLLWVDDSLRFIGGDSYEENIGVIRVPFVPTAEEMAKHLAVRFAAEFENVIFASVTVHESTLTAARYSATRLEAEYEVERSLSLVD